MSLFFNPFIASLKTVYASRRTRVLLWGIFLCALMLHVGIAVQLRHHPVVLKAPESERGYDQYEWNRLAERIADDGDWLLKNGAWEGKPFFHYAPGFVYFLAIIFRVFGHRYFAVSIVQALMGAALVLIIFSCARRLFNERVGLVAACFAATYDMFMLYENMILRDFSAAFFFALFFLSVLIAHEKKHLQWWFFAGAIGGVSNLFKPNIFIVLALLWIVLTQGKQRGLKHMIVAVMSFLLGAAVVISPVARYNFTGGERSLICMQGPRSFWIGNAPGVDGFGVRSTIESVSVLKKQSQGTFKNLASLYSTCLKKFPAFYRQLYWRKLKMFWNGFEIPASISYYLFKAYPSWLRFGLTSSSLILPLALAGMVIGLFRKKQVGLLYLFALGYSVTIIMFLVQARYRMGVMPFLMIFAAYAVIEIYDAFRLRERLSLIMLSGSVIIAAFFSYPDATCAGAFPKGLFDKGIPWWQYSNFAMATRDVLLDNDNLTRFDARYRAAHIMLSKIYLARAIERAPGIPILYYRMAEFCEMAGEYYDAVRYLDNYLTLDPHNAQALNKRAHLIDLLSIK